MLDARLAIYICVDEIATSDRPPTYPVGLHSDVVSVMDACFMRDQARRPSVQVLLTFPAFVRFTTPPSQQPVTTASSAPFTATTATVPSSSTVRYPLDQASPVSAALNRSVRRTASHQEGSPDARLVSVSSHSQLDRTQHSAQSQLPLRQPQHQQLHPLHNQYQQLQIQQGISAQESSRLSGAADRHHRPAKEHLTSVEGVFMPHISSLPTISVASPTLSAPSVSPTGPEWAARRQAVGHLSQHPVHNQPNYGLGRYQQAAVLTSGTADLCSSSSAIVRPSPAQSLADQSNLPVQVQTQAINFQAHQQGHAHLYPLLRLQHTHHLMHTQLHPAAPSTQHPEQPICQLKLNSTRHHQFNLKQRLGHQPQIHPPQPPAHQHSQMPKKLQNVHQQPLSSNQHQQLQYQQQYSKPEHFPYFRRLKALSHETDISAAAPISGTNRYLNREYPPRD
ncbi:unnamed protein product [Protopolystoma xenopodis]|uniref:Uncharacterized protein n=1 Tax=Protopolystoma xenopodis TaxID=117903 RepID=A0A3S5A9W7_9PLAT|nr:unnamed protein product [Protopolystoma xenopodis]